MRTLILIAALATPAVADAHCYWGYSSPDPRPGCNAKYWHGVYARRSKSPSRRAVIVPVEDRSWSVEIKAPWMSDHDWGVLLLKEHANEQ